VRGAPRGASSCRAVKREALVVTGVRKVLRGREVLRGCDLRIEPGTVAWLSGANGAGKTTLLRIAAGLLRADAGSVALGDMGPERDRRRFARSVGFLPAGDRALQPRLSVRENVLFAARMALLDGGEARRAVADVLERIGLAELASRRTDRLSLGQRQRVRLAASLVHRPKVLLLDEPYTSLDGQGLGALGAILDEQAAAGGAAVWASPEVEGGRLRADVAVRIDGGVTTAP
jgi:ABC-type multidrug transport system ATPase subunit